MLLSFGETSERLLWRLLTISSVLHDKVFPVDEDEDKLLTPRDDEPGRSLFIELFTGGDEDEEG